MGPIRRKRTLALAHRRRVLGNLHCTKPLFRLSDSVWSPRIVEELHAIICGERGSVDMWERIDADSVHMTTSSKLLEAFFCVFLRDSIVGCIEGGSFSPRSDLTWDDVTDLLAVTPEGKLRSSQRDIIELQRVIGCLITAKATKTLHILPVQLWARFAQINDTFIAKQREESFKLEASGKLVVKHKLGPLAFFGVDCWTEPLTHALAELSSDPENACGTHIQNAWTNKVEPYLPSLIMETAGPLSIWKSNKVRCNGAIYNHSAMVRDYTFFLTHLEDTEHSAPKSAEDPRVDMWAGWFAIFLAESTRSEADSITRQRKWDKFFKDLGKAVERFNASQNVVKRPHASLATHTLIKDAARREVVVLARQAAE